jgi:hypothetical protein
MSTSIPRGNLLKLFAVQVTFDPAAVATITTAEQNVTVTGVKVGDIVIAVNKPTLTAGVGIVNARVSAADTVSVQFVNPTAGSVNPASETYTFVIARPEPMGSVFNA